MANIKTTPEEWERAREYFEAGLSLSQIVDKTGISKTQLSKRSNLEGWAKGTEKEQLIRDEVRIAEAKGTLNGTALDVHLELVKERTTHIQFFTNAALKNASMAVKKLTDKTTQADHRLVADTILKSKEAVLGKGPETAVQVNTTVNSTTSVTTGVDPDDLTDDELLAIASAGRGEPTDAPPRPN